MRTPFAVFSLSITGRTGGDKCAILKAEVKKVKKTKKGVCIMEIAKISSKGQITIPVSVRNRLHLNTGDKVLILEENGRFYIENAANVAFQHVEEGFRGAAAEAGFKSEDEMQDYMKEIREELRRK